MCRDCSERSARTQQEQEQGRRGRDGTGRRGRQTGEGEGPGPVGASVAGPWGARRVPYAAGPGTRGARCGDAQLLRRLFVALALARGGPGPGRGRGGREAGHWAWSIAKCALLSSALLRAERRGAGGESNVAQAAGRRGQSRVGWQRRACRGCAGL